MKNTIKINLFRLFRGQKFDSSYHFRISGDNFTEGFADERHLKNRCRRLLELLFY